MALFLFARAIIEGLLWSSHEPPPSNNVDSRSFQFDGVHVFKWLRKTLPRDRQVWPNLPLLKQVQEDHHSRPKRWHCAARPRRL
jgi:hypothetical protein